MYTVLYWILHYPKYSRQICNRLLIVSKARSSREINAPISLSLSLYIYIYMFHAMWEFTQSADCATQSEKPQIACQSADCVCNMGILRLRSAIRLRKFPHCVEHIYRTTGRLVPRAVPNVKWRQRTMHKCNQLIEDQRLSLEIIEHFEHCTIPCATDFACPML